MPVSIFNHGRKNGLTYRKVTPYSGTKAWSRSSPLTLGYEIYTTFRIGRQLDSKEIELESLKGNLAQVVKEQFKSWSLSNSESEVAWLIIKGFSFNEISAMRLVAEKTVRAQAVAVYRKSGTGNRSEFTATFLDDLLNHG